MIGKGNAQPPYNRKDKVEMLPKQKGEPDTEISCLYSFHGSSALSFWANMFLIYMLFTCFLLLFLEKSEDIIELLNVFIFLKLNAALDYNQWKTRVSADLPSNDPSLW